MKTRQGFTLIELLVVVLIIGILSSVALPQYTKAVEKARATEAVQTAATLTRAIDIWLMENGGFPASTVEDLGLSIEIDGGEWHEGNFYTTAHCYTNS
ncbi:MAG: prepilin-type N-terminal cleavage/methylation domain-containing protein, partial [Elusimicrobiaceae bacterium]|nr:prepilin-type N-terminal cleavage/methylation domain-containing protein [Elusimicrobiaceae bacterium]